MAHIDPYGVPQFLDQPGWCDGCPAKSYKVPPDIVRKFEEAFNTRIRPLTSATDLFDHADKVLGIERKPPSSGHIEPTAPRHPVPKGVTGKPYRTADGADAYLHHAGVWVISDGASIAATTVRPRMEGEAE